MAKALATRRANLKARRMLKMPEGSEKNKGGRPPEEEVSLRWKAIAEKFESAYIEDTEIPIA